MKIASVADVKARFSAYLKASELAVDAGMLYRLMRALGSLELLHEDQHRTFSLTPMGELLRRDHPHTLRSPRWPGLR